MQVIGIFYGAWLYSHWGRGGALFGAALVLAMNALDLSILIWTGKTMAGFAFDFGLWSRGLLP